MNKKPILGRGLAALLEPQSQSPALMSVPDSEITESVSTNTLKISDLGPGKYQPRTHFSEAEMEELTSSIREKGVLQPILVRAVEGKSYTYEIIAGERRWRAARRAGLDVVPVIIKDFSDQEALEVSIIENIQRHDLNPLEEAEGYGRLLQEFNYTQEELAHSLGKSRPYITNSLRLMNLPEGVKELVRSGKLSSGHGRALLSATNPMELAQTVLDKGLSVRKTEELASGKAPSPKAKSPKITSQTIHGEKPKSEDQLYIEEKLTETLEVQVTLDMNGEEGVVCLHYKSLDELDLLLQKLEQTR